MISFFHTKIISFQDDTLSIYLLIDIVNEVSLDCERQEHNINKKYLFKS